MGSFKKYPVLVAMLVIVAMVMAVAAYAADTKAPAGGQGKACMKAAGCGMCASTTKQTADKGCCAKAAGETKKVCTKAGTTACKDAKAKCGCADCKTCCKDNCKDCCKDGKCTKAHATAKADGCKHCPKSSAVKVTKKAPVTAKKVN